MEFSHAPVLLQETVEFLAPRPGGVYVDGTVGGGGHARRILELSSPDGIVIGIDRDPQALEASARHLEPFGRRVILHHGTFDRVGEFLDCSGIGQVDGILLDLGVSSYQLDTPGRGFAFQQDGPLDMRMDPTSGETASDLLMRLSEEEIADVLFRYGEERMSKRIARAIVHRRVQGRIEGTRELATLVHDAIPPRFREKRIDPATRTFQALRIAVNDELSILERGLRAGIERLKGGGRIVVISFHSLEDRIVKETFRSLTGICRCPPGLPSCICSPTATLRVVTTRPVTATEEEICRNRRARSARLRCAEKRASPIEESP